MTPAAPVPNPASLFQAAQVARINRVSPPPPSAELHTSSIAVPQHPAGEFSSRSDERDGPGDHWVTIDGRHVLIHEPQGTKAAREQSLAWVSILGRNVVIIDDLRLSADEKLKVNRAIGAGADLLNKNADKLTAEEKNAIGQISSVRVTPDPQEKLGATGNGSMTLSTDYIEDPNVSPAWIGSLIGHEGQHYLNAGKYSGENLWRDEQSASRTQFGISNKIGLSTSQRDSLQKWMDDQNRAAMQEHMVKGFHY